jgi:arylsulfatase A-like enzyme
VSPSFLLFITDQQRADYLGCYGHPVLKTPHIDSLAASGVAFDRFYVASPVCMPNRASLMTGRMPSVHGARANGIPLARSQRTFVQLLAAAGYHTALIGKSHLQNFTGMPPNFNASAPEHLVPPPRELRYAVDFGLDGGTYDEENPMLWESGKSEVNLPFYGFQHVDLVTGHGDQCGGAYLHWLRQQLPDADRLRDGTSALPHEYACPQAVRTALPEELYPTSYIRNRAVAYLDGHVSRNPSQPFFTMVSFPDPHHPFTPPGEYWDMYSPFDMAAPTAFTRDDWRPSPYVARLLAARAAGTANVQAPDAFTVDEREAREAQALTCGMITMIDDAIGQILDALERSGRRRETVILFMSDHGDYLGDHRLLLRGAAMYQGILRTPFIWSDPDGPRAGRTDGLASTIDVPATILDRAGLAPYQGMQGVSLLPTLEGGAAGRDRVLVEYEHQRGTGVPGRMPRQHTLVTRGWRMSLAEGTPGGELYNLADDPEEFRNLWGDPAAAGPKAELLEQMVLAEIEARDQLPLPTGRA